MNGEDEELILQMDRGSLILTYEEIESLYKELENIWISRDNLVAMDTVRKLRLFLDNQ